VETGLPWLVLVVIPEDDILGTIQRSFQYTGLAAILLAGLVLILGLTYANRCISRPFARIARNLESMARLEIDEVPKFTESRLSEVADLIAARELLRSGLWNSLKYVPDQPVRELLEQEQKAELGGDHRRLTVFFSDVVGFTRWCNVVYVNSLSFSFPSAMAAAAEHCESLGEGPLPMRSIG
jgi:adenylate cyclase